MAAVAKSYFFLSEENKKKMYDEILAIYTEERLADRLIKENEVDNVLLVSQRLNDFVHDRTCDVANIIEDFDLAKFGLVFRRILNFKNYEAGFPLSLENCLLFSIILGVSLDYLLKPNFARNSWMCFPIPEYDKTIKKRDYKPRLTKFCDEHYIICDEDIISLMEMYLDLNDEMKAEVEAIAAKYSMKRIERKLHYYRIQNNDEVTSDFPEDDLKGKEE